MITPLALAETFDIDTEISEEDAGQFEEILEPVITVYNFGKYVTTFVAGFMLLGAGIIFMTSGNNPSKRDKAKLTATYAVVGMIVVWSIPLIIALFA